MIDKKNRSQKVWKKVDKSWPKTREQAWRLVKKIRLKKNLYSTIKRKKRAKNKIDNKIPYQ